jgi:hypothetical protein
MLQAHSLLWHYLWVAPNVLLFIFGVTMWRRGLQKKYPVFIAFAIIGSLVQLAVYAADIVPTVSAKAWWGIFWAGLLIEALLKFALVGEIFAHAFDSYRSIARLGKLLIRGVGVALVIAAALAAAVAPKDSPYGIISGAHILQQTIYFVESGALIFIFLFAAYFRLKMDRLTFGIAFGLAISAVVHLGTWAVLANQELPAAKRAIFDFLNMGTYNVCVLIWFYFFLKSGKAPTLPSFYSPDLPSSPRLDEDLDVWNRELERLIHQ